MPRILTKVVTKKIRGRPGRTKTRELVRRKNRDERSRLPQALRFGRSTTATACRCTGIATSRPYQIFTEISPFGKQPNSEEIYGGNVRKPKSRVARNDPKFGKIWPGYAAGTLSKIKNFPKFCRGLPGRAKPELVPRRKDWDKHRHAPQALRFGRSTAATAYRCTGIRPRGHIGL